MSFNPEYFFPTIITNITSLNGGVFGTVKASDVYPAVDVTDVSQSPYGTTKPYQFFQLANFILNALSVPTYAAVLSASIGSNLNATYTSGSVAGQPGIGATLTNAGTLTAFVLDGQPGVLNARYLIKDQSNPAQNGIYTLTTIGSVSIKWVLTRSIDFNTSTTISPAVTTNIYNGGVVYILYGAVNANTAWRDSYSGTMTVGTTNINWSVGGVLTLKPPTIQNFTLGSGIYTTPAGVLYIRIRMVGGGGGGAGAAGGTIGGAGGNSTFGTSLLVTNGGGGGANTGTGIGGPGGTASLGSGPIGTALQGGSGGAGVFTIASIYGTGGMGAASPWGGAGGTAVDTAGQSAIANSGSGGGGGGSSTNDGVSGSGGGAGGYVDAIITLPSSNYPYAIGAAGTAGAAGGSGYAGGTGGSGYIEVTEFYS